jgi:hypothetical protein
MEISIMNLLETLRDKLNKLAEDEQKLYEGEILKISQQLDKLISKEYVNQQF